MCSHTEFTFILEGRIKYDNGTTNDWVDLPPTPIMMPLYQTLCDDMMLDKVVLHYRHGSKMHVRKKQR